MQRFKSPSLVHRSDRDTLLSGTETVDALMFPGTPERPACLDLVYIILRRGEGPFAGEEDAFCHSDPKITEL